MSFATPWMLAGLVAVVIPVLLHFRKRREEVIGFPATALLAKVSRRRKRRLELRKVILLVVRILAVAAVVLAASRPGVAVRRPGGIRTGPALAQIIVLDDSLSMRLRGKDGRTIFDRAKELTLAEIARLRLGDAVALILSGRPLRFPIPKVDFDLSRVRRALDTAQPTYLGGDIEGALRSALLVLQDSPLPQREVVLITDLSEGRPDEHWPPWSPGTGIGLRVIDAGTNVPRVNATVDRVHVNLSPEGAAREVLIEARITNYSNTRLKGLDVILEVEGAEVAHGNLDVPPRGSAIKRFTHRFASDGMKHGHVRIPKDRLKEDDARHFSLMVRQSISVLVINGDSRPGSYRDEAFYLHRALETPMPGEIPLQPVVVDVDAAQAGLLAGNEVVFLAGVARLSPSLASRIIEFVERGGGLFVSPAQAGTGLNLIEKILPAKVRSIRQAPRPERPFRVAGVSRTHPMFQLFGNGHTGLEKTRVLKHLLVEPEPSADRHILVELVDGLPLLLDWRVGHGMVMLLTTTVDRDWTDLPIRPGYLPLVQRAARHLAGRLDDRRPRRVLTGQPVQIEVSKGMQRLVVRGPGASDTTYPSKELTGKSAIDFKATYEPGSYQVWAEIPGFGGLKELPALGFVVEIDSDESNTSRVISPVDSEDRAGFAPVVGNLPIWPYLLIAAVLLLLLETLLSSQGLKRSHVKS